MMIRGSRALFAATVLLGAGALGACSDDDDTLRVPSISQATAISPTRVSLTYTNVSRANGYLVQRATGGAGDFQTIGTATTNTYVDSVGLAANGTYRYRVAAYRGTDTTTFSAPSTVTTGNAFRATINGDITSNRTLSRDTIYTLGTFVHVANGATLTIQSGTRIEGDIGTALFVLRGAKIRALGTADAPIVMTSARPVGQRAPGDWGGLILVGNGQLNRGPSVILEGTNTGATNPAVDYAGGTNNADDSGELRYVRVEFAGFGPQPDAELNSVTFAAVGSGTRVEYVQTLAGLDDSFEWFGGAVDAKHLVSYESGDDHFDASEGYQGRNQYLIALQSTILTPRTGSGNTSNDPQGIENDGCAGSNCFSGQNSQPLTIPMFANFTLVGTGSAVSVPSSGGRGMMLRRGTGGHYVNGIITRWPRAAISLRDATTNDRITAGDLVLRNLLLADNGAVFDPQVAGSSTMQYTMDEAANAIQSVNAQAASLFVGLPATPTTAGLDWRPAAGSAAATGGLATFPANIATKAGSFVTGTAYRGAADPNGARWWEGWTNYARN